MGYSVPDCHLKVACTDIRTVQELLGYSDMSTFMIYREPLKTAVFSPSLTQAVRNPQICLFFVQFRLFLGFFVPHSSRIGPLQAHLGL